MIFFVIFIHSNQQNVLHTSTSEDEEERTQVLSRSLTPRNLKHLYNPSDESYGSTSPLHLNGIPMPVHMNRYTNPNMYHRNDRQVNGGNKQ